jgi:hypothetical protein
MKLKAFEWRMLRPGSVLLLLLAGLLLGPAATMAADPNDDAARREFTKTINREFTTTANGMTALYNQYGKVTVNTWNKNSVKIDITIIVNASDQRAADRTFDRIKINFTSTAGYIKAETFMEESNWWPKGQANGTQDFTINYNVSMPIGNQLDLKNKYGNSYVGALNGKLLAEIRYGDLRTEALGADADLYVGYGKVYLARAQNVSGHISYGVVTLPLARDVEFDTKHCTLNIEKAGSVRLTSRYDDFNFGTLDDLRLNTKYATVRVRNAKSTLLTAQYTNVKVASLSEKVDADLVYGSLQVDAVGRNFSMVNAVGENTSVQLAIESGTAFSFDIEGSGIVTPATATIRHRVSTLPQRATGFVGNANGRGLVKVRLTGGDVVLKSQK